MSNIKPSSGGSSRSGPCPQNGSGSSHSQPPERSPSELRQELHQRVREIEQRGEALSLAEKIVKELDYDMDQPARDKDIDVEQMNLTRIQKYNLDDLRGAAASEGVADVASMERRELIFSILSTRLQRSGLMFGEGTLEVLPDGFGFLRSQDHHYLSCPDDIYVSPSQIRKFRLRTGATVCGQIRPPKEKERYFALLRVRSVNGMEPKAAAVAKDFDELTPLHPEERIILEHAAGDISTRVVDLVAPIGFGQRGLIVSPPRAGKTILMQNMAKAVLNNYPEAYVMMLLVDERPEEVTDMEREVKGERCEVISSTFDEIPARHIQVADMVLEKSKRLVEAGQDVLIFLDSITRLGRAWNQECQQSGKTLSGGLDANALQEPKAFFGSARKVEEGGSLTIIATALVDTGSKMDDVIFEEFKGTGNMEIILDRALVDRRTWPAIDINASGTRREERLLDPEEFDRICRVRRILSELNPPDAMEMLTNRLRKTATNAEFLMSLHDHTL